MYSVFSILVWSVLVDVVCYFAFPSMIFGQTIFTYILNGILFNFKYVFYNILYLFLLEVTPLLMSKLKLNLNGTCFKNESLILKMK
ncbi:hypothetical protein EOM09_05950 [bacterium]|nr:hypothetical protein [bacterium]